MARIYKAEHEGLRRNVALKVLIDGFAQDPEGRERFLREARIAAAIKHPNVVNIFDVGVQDEVPYLVMELLEGEDLEAMVHRTGALSEAALVDVVVPIVAGLAAVHDAGVVHRDLKPGNIFLARGRNDELEPRLLDFGISRAAESEQFKLTTARGLLMGTPLYMSPEAIQGGEITALSDQYSLGVVLYECSTGFNPFSADTLAETVRRVTMGDYEPVSQHCPTLSRRMARIIERAMSLDPAQRFTDLREMGRELLLLAGQRTRITWSLTFGEVVGRRTGSVAMMSGGVPPNVPGRSPPVRRSFGTTAAVLFGIASFAAAIALVWTGGRAATSEAVVATHPLRREEPNASGGGQEGTRPPATVDANEARGRTLPSAPERERPASIVGEGGASPLAPSAEPARIVEREGRPGVEQESRTRPAALHAATPAKPKRKPPTPLSRARKGQPPAAEDTPEWILSSDNSGRQHKNSTSVGTNNAPIFE